MKVNEIVREERLDEALPLIAGLSIPVVLGYISAAITAYSVFEVYQFVKAYSENPEDLTEDQWGDLFVDVAIAAVPAFVKLGKPAILKLIPRSWRNWGGRWIRDKINAKLLKDKAGILKKYGPAAQRGKTPEEIRKLQARRRLELAKADKKAQEKLSKVSKTPVYDAITSGLSTGIVAKLFVDYWTKFEDLTEQYKKVQAGDLSDFEGMTKEQALQKITMDRDKLVGELTVSVGAVIAPLALASKIKLFGALFGKIMPGGKYVAGVIQLPANAIAAFAKTGGASIAAFLQTESGQKLLENQLVQVITTTTGAAVTSAYNAFLDMAELVGNKVGVDVSKATAALRPTIQSPTASAGPGTGSAATTNKLAITSDPKNGNIKFIDGKQVTGPDGYVLTSIPNAIRDIRRKADAAGIPDPFGQLQFDPNKQYVIPPA